MNDFWNIGSYLYISGKIIHSKYALFYLSLTDYLSKNGVHLIDRGYLDFERLFVIHKSKSFFVIRAKHNLRYKRQYSAKADKSTGVLCDQTGELEGFYSSKEYPEKIRRIKFHDEEQNRTFVF